MVIRKTAEEKKLTMALEGRLDTTTAPEMENALADLAEAESLVLDLEELEYVSSAGLRVILKAQKMMNARGGMTLINVNDSVMEVFEITGFADILTIE